MVFDHVPIGLWIFMVIIARTAGNFEVPALAFHGQMQLTASSAIVIEVADSHSQEPGENLCTSFVCEVSAEKINTILSCKYRYEHICMSECISSMHFQNICPEVFSRSATHKHI